MSIALQLQAIKAVIRGQEDPIRRPITRPSVIFSPKEAADIDLRSILPLSQSGLDALIELDDRFSSYKSTLFSHASLDIDREKMVPKEEEKLNKSISSYLQLLAGHLHLPSALRTLEYLIRRYQVHIFNVEELVLCALPYHDTHAFVRIVQLIDLGNKRWAFLEAVKTSGAPPPRKVIVQQCIRDKGVLEALCNYASPTKGFQHSRPVVCFCTAVTVEALGSVPKLDTDTVQRVLSFVFNGLNPSVGGSRDQMAGAIMVVGLVATRATLSAKLVQSLVFFIARLAQHEARKSSDLPWLRVIIMAIVSLVQSQSSQIIPKKIMVILKEIRDLTGILSGLSQEFNIQKFLHLYLESLIDYSSSDDCYHHLLVTALETLPITEFIEKIVRKILAHCMKFLNTDTSNSREAGNKAKQFLSAMDKQYPSELRGAVRKFLENSKMKLGEEESAFLIFCQMFDGNSDVPVALSDSKVWFSLEHPKAAVRRATLLDIASSGVSKSFAHTWKLVNIKDAIVRRLQDDDLGVVQAALSVSGLYDIVTPASLLRACQNVLSRCIEIIKKGTELASEASDVAALCLDRMILDIPLHQDDIVMEVAGIILPVLVFLPQTWKVNMRALELVSKLQWPYFSNILTCDAVLDKRHVKRLDDGQMTDVNLQTIRSFAENFAANPGEHIGWLIACSRHNKLARCIFFFTILQALVACKGEFAKIWRLFEACSVALKNEWREMVSVNGVVAEKFLKDEWCEVESEGSIIIAGELNLERFDKSYRRLASQLLHLDADMLSNKILICIYWCLLETCSGTVSTDKVEDQQLLLLDELFLFFASSSSLGFFKKQLPVIVRNCCKAPFLFLSKYFIEEGFSAEVQVESLLSFESICSIYAADTDSTNENTLLSLSMFPLFLVPLASDNKEIRTAAVNCVEGIYKLWQGYNVSRLKDGNDATVLQCAFSPAFGDFLESIVNQKRLISSDVNFLQSLLTSLLSPSGGSLLVPDSLHKRFDQSAKDSILLFILSSVLKFPSYGKKKVFSLLKAMGNSILQVEGCKDLLLGLLQKRKECYSEIVKLHEGLCESEIETLCLLLEFCVPRLSSSIDVVGIDCLVTALRVESLVLDDPAVEKPCVTVLKNLTNSFYENLNCNIQDDIFFNLVSLFRSDNAIMRNAARDAVVNLNISCSTILRFLEEIFVQDQYIGSSKRSKKKKSMAVQRFTSCRDLVDHEGNIFVCLGSLLDILLLKKDIKNRVSLVQPLFVVLGKLFSNDCLSSLLSCGTAVNGSESEISESLSASLHHVQQSTLLILKNIIDSFIIDYPDKDDLCNKPNVSLLVECAQSAKDATTRNHIFMLLSSVSKISSRWLSEHIIDLFIVIGESAIKQSDSHSQQVLENLISTLVPCWLAKTNSVAKLFQIFIKDWPDIADHRRLTLLVYLLRTLGETDSLGTLCYQLLHSLTLRIKKSSSYFEINLHELISRSSMVFKEWEFMFTLQLCNQYSSKIWLPSLVKLFQEIEYSSKQYELLPDLFMALQFTLEKLRDTEFVFELESGQDAGYVQDMLGALTEQVVLHLQLVGNRCKQLSLSKGVLKEIRKCISQVLRNLTTWMKPDTFFKSIVHLLGNGDGSVIKKTLGFLCESIKDQVTARKKDMEKARRKRKTSIFPLQITDHVMPSFNELCSKINQLISSSSTYTSVKLAAISSIETLARELPCDEPVFTSCLQYVVVEIGSSDFALSSACIRCTAVLVGILGSRALKHLPCLMAHVFEKAHQVSRCPYGKYKQMTGEVESYKVPLLLPILSALEAVITNLSGFMNPYLDDILDLVILHPDYISHPEAKMKTKAAAVRKLLTEKVPARLTLPPLLKVYETAIKGGESSLSFVFEMLANMISGMDRSSIGSYHVKIYEQCLASLDIRHQAPESVNDINMVEQSVIRAMVVLTMKLTETMFRPLFIHSLEWAESELEGNLLTKSISINRSISFYTLVNNLILQHRSLFVPYFKYLLEGFIRYLTEEQAVDLNSLSQKRKKAKLGDCHANVKTTDFLSTKLWHVRSLILKALYQCFLYDTMESKFLDTSNFQALLKPIISQFMVEAPAILNNYPDLPTVEEVDESLVLCLGQMAVTAKSDVLWKPLNHEVLMQTRNEQARPKILGLKVVKYLVEHLREEYLVFLPETIPFLGELLEDVELPVKTLAQDILKEMEVLSGENLKQYL